MIDPNWCFENPIEAAQEIHRLQELCKKAAEVVEESQDWNWLDDDVYIPEMQSLVDKLEEIKNAV